MLKIPHTRLLLTSDNRLQSKRRRSDKDHRDGDDESGAQPEQPPEDPLKDATTLYVGNLWVCLLPEAHWPAQHITGLQVLCSINDTAKPGIADTNPS